MQIKDLNLYGRMIYGISCFIQCWKVFGEENYKNEIKRILLKFCEFTSTHNLSQWESEIIPLTPACVLVASDESGKIICTPERCSKCTFEYEFCSFATKCNLIRESKRYSKEQKIYELYANIDNDYLAILDMLCCIGTGELYGTPSDLNESEMYIIDIIKILKKHTVAIPEIDLFKDYILNNPKKSMDYFGDKVDCTNLL